MHNKPLKNYRTISIGVSCLIVIISLVLYFFLIWPKQKYYYAHHINIKGIYLLHPLAIQEFELLDTQNKRFTKKNLQGHWSMLFFGFTHCGLVCPTTLNTLNKMYVILKRQLPENKLPHVVFITVDPERDTMAALKNYVTAFNTHFLGAKTTADDTATIENQFHIASTKTRVHSQNGNDYTIAHSAEILLVNPDAKIQAYFSYPQQPEQMVADYYAILGSVYH